MSDIQDKVWVYFLATPDGEHLSSIKWTESQLSRVPFSLGVPEEQSFTKDEFKLLGF